jgi:hypothetical protein
VLVGLLALALVAAVTAALHERHYKERRWLHLDARLESIEKIVLEKRSV